MREREQNSDPSPESKSDDFWQLDLAVGEGVIQREQKTIRLRVHTSEERYRSYPEFIPLTHKAGQRTYVLARPYILEPEIVLTVGLYDRPTPEGQIGKVTDLEWEGMRHQDIGNAQAWFYPADQVILLWECYLFEWCRSKDPRQDETHKALWTGFESTLAERFPAATRLMTTWEDIYERAVWQEFLQMQGYSELGRAVFGKELTKKSETKQT